MDCLLSLRKYAVRLGLVALVSICCFGVASASHGDDEAEPPEVSEEIDLPSELASDPPDVEEVDVETPDVEAPEIEQPEAEQPEAAEVEEPEAADSAEDNSGSNDLEEDHSGSSDDQSGSGGNSDSSSNGDDSVGESHSGSSTASGGESSDSVSFVSAAHEDVLVERDELGDERVADEVLFSAPAADIEAALGLGFSRVSEIQLAALEQRVARLHAPPGVSVDQAILMLQAMAPNAIAAPNGVYRSSQASVVSRPASRSATSRGGSLVGVIDTGVDASAFAEGQLVGQRSFAGPAPVAREHGAMVVELAMDHGARVVVADVFRAGADGRAFAASDSIAAALDWLIASNVSVINISIEGPNNALLGALVARAASRGQLIVAAAGNGGPLARPSFPAAFQGAVAVTAVDNNNRPYLRANRGAYIAFAAPGVDLTLRSPTGSVVVSGTSFAAPLVAARLARLMPSPSPDAARTALADLQSEVIDLGEPGRDPIFGWGALRD